MKHGGKVLVGLWASLVLCTAANAATDDPPGNPYQGIVESNIFKLKPPPPPPDPADNKPPPPKITLTGITTILGRKLVLMETPPPPGKPGEPAKPKQSLILTIGERQGEIEVLEIDEIAGAVKVNNSGNIVTLTFEKDGVKLASTPMPGAPGVPPPPGGMPPPIPGSFNPAGGAAPVNLSFPSRPLRGSVPGSAAVAPGATPGTVTLPGFGASAAQQSTSIPQSTLSLSPEEQVIAIEAQREITKNQVMSGKLPPLPPTPLTPAGAPGSLTPTPTTDQLQVNPVHPVIPPRRGLPPMPPPLPQ